MTISLFDVLISNLKELKLSTTLLVKRNNISKSELSNLIETIDNSVSEFETHLVRVENNYIRNKCSNLLSELKNSPSPKDINTQINDLINLLQTHHIYEELYKNNP